MPARSALWTSDGPAPNEESVDVGKGDFEITVPASMKKTPNPLAGMDEEEKRNWTNDRRELAEDALHPESAEELKRMVRGPSL